MPVSLSTALTTWQFEPLVAVPAALLACCYLAAAWHCGRRPRASGPRRPGNFPARLLRGAAAWRQSARPWPDGRTLAFLGGLSAIIVATQGWAGVYDETSLADHMVQHLLLVMVAPPLLIAGRPVTLLLHTTGNPWHTRVKRLARSRLVTVLTWPPTGVALYSAAVLGTHLTGLLLARGTLHDAEHFLYLAAGYLFFLPVIGSEPVRWRLPLLGRYLLLLVAMPADIATGAVLMLHGPLGPFAAGDVRAAGVIMLAGSDLIMAGLAAGLATALVTRRARDRTAVPDLAAYNAFLASLDVQPEPPEA
ncbi:MAG TPA: cytochrome c oxidase assembly protein [Trebonia sp.]